MELNKNGYPIWKDSKRLVHRSIAEKYILDGDNLRENEQVHHVDGDKLNFHPRNLIVLHEKDHKKITGRLNKERNLNKANLLVFVIALIVFVKMIGQVNDLWSGILLGLLIIGLLISTYSNFADWFIRKTRLYRIIDDSS